MKLSGKEPLMGSQLPTDGHFSVQCAPPPPLLTIAVFTSVIFHIRDFSSML